MVNFLCRQLFINIP